MLLDRVSVSTWRTRLVWLPPILRVLWLTLAVLALARLQIVERYETPAKESLALMIVVDVSGSMGLPDETDSKQTRLDRVRQRLCDLLDSRSWDDVDQIGLVGFAESPRLLCPPTTDRSVLGRFVSRLEVDRLADRTNLGDGLALAAAHVERVPAHRRRLLLLSDGSHNFTDGLDPLVAARAAEALRIPIDAVSLFDPKNSEQPEEAERDEVRLERIATLTGGHFARAYTMDDANIAAWYASEVSSELRGEPVGRYRDLFKPILAAALVVGVVEVIVRRIIFGRDWG